MEQAADFLAESAALHALVSPLTDEQCEQKTAFKDWTVNMVLRHLHFWNMAADLALSNEPAFDALAHELVEALMAGEAMTVFEEKRLDGLAGPSLIAAWRDYADAMADRFAVADPKARVKWMGPDMSVRSSITARLMETWAHGQAVYDLLGVVRRNEDRIRNIVVLGVKTYGWTYAVRGEAAPEPMPFIRLNAPSGAVWEYGAPSESERIEGAAEEFCQVVTQTRNIADTGLRVTGANAADWMSKAQCFAGPPETPPAPGTRRRKETARQ